MLSVFVQACSSNAAHPAQENGKQQNDYKAPAPGTIIATESMPVAADDLNHFTFSVKVITTQYSKSGTYDVVAAWGPDNARGTFTMPQGGGNLKPIIKKSDSPYTYVVGFYYGDDKTFHDYYEIKGAGGQIEMKYIKGYSFK